MGLAHPRLDLRQGQTDPVPVLLSLGDFELREGHEDDLTQRLELGVGADYPARLRDDLDLRDPGLRHPRQLHAEDISIPGCKDEVVELEDVSLLVVELVAQPAVGFSLVDGQFEHLFEEALDEPVGDGAAEEVVVVGEEVADGAVDDVVEEVEGRLLVVVDLAVRVEQRQRAHCLPHAAPPRRGFLEAEVLLRNPPQLRLRQRRRLRHLLEQHLALLRHARRQEVDQRALLEEDAHRVHQRSRLEDLVHHHQPPALRVLHAQNAEDFPDLELFDLFEVHLVGWAAGQAELDEAVAGGVDGADHLLLGRLGLADGELVGGDLDADVGQPVGLEDEVLDGLDGLGVELERGLARLPLAALEDEAVEAEVAELEVAAVGAVDLVQNLLPGLLLGLPAEGEVDDLVDLVHHDQAEVEALAALGLAVPAGDPVEVDGAVLAGLDLLAVELLLAGAILEALDGVVLGEVEAGGEADGGVVIARRADGGDLFLEVLERDGVVLVGQHGGHVGDLAVEEREVAHLVGHELGVHEERREEGAVLRLPELAVLHNKYKLVSKNGNNLSFVMSRCQPALPAALALFPYTVG